MALAFLQVAYRAWDVSATGRRRPQGSRRWRSGFGSEPGGRSAMPSASYAIATRWRRAGSVVGVVVGPGEDAACTASALPVYTPVRV